MNQLGTVYATKRRRRNGKSLKPPPKDGVTKSNPSKRHRERLNAELDTLASLLPFEQNILSKLDRLSILRLSVSYLRTKSYFQVVMHKDKEDGLHHDSQFRNRDLTTYDHTLLDGEMFLQALNGFLLILTCEGEVFFATHSIESYLGFHQSDIVHQSVYELVHSEDREELQRQLMWNSFLPPESANIVLQDVLQPENCHLLERSFTVRFRCLLDNTSGFLRLDIRGRIKVLHGQNRKTEEPPLALFAICTPFGPPSLLEIPQKEVMFKSKHKLDLTLVSMDQRGKMLLGYSDTELANLGGYDLVHYDDLAYVASAHQELLKTGASGMIAYRYQTKEGQWQWLQTSSRLVYKNSKPDFVISTHRPLMEEEGRDLLGKRTMDFKVSYLDAGLTNSYFTDSDQLVVGTHHSSSSPSSHHAGSTPPQSGAGAAVAGGQRVNRRYKTQLRDFLSTCRTKRKLSHHATTGTGTGTVGATAAPPATGLTNTMTAVQEYITATDTSSAAAAAVAAAYSNLNNMYTTPYPGTTGSPADNGLTTYMGHSGNFHQGLYPTALDNRFLTTENLFHQYRPLGSYYPDYHTAATTPYVSNGFLDMSPRATTCSLPTYDASPTATGATTSHHHLHHQLGGASGTKTTLVGTEADKLYSCQQIVGDAGGGGGGGGGTAVTGTKYTAMVDTSRGYVVAATNLGNTAAGKCLDVTASPYSLSPIAPTVTIQPIVMASTSSPSSVMGDVLSSSHSTGSTKIGSSGKTSAKHSPSMDGMSSSNSAGSSPATTTSATAANGLITPKLEDIKTEVGLLGQQQQTGSPPHHHGLHASIMPHHYSPPTPSTPGCTEAVSTASTTTTPRQTVLMWGSGGTTTLNHAATGSSNSRSPPSSNPGTPGVVTNGTPAPPSSYVTHPDSGSPGGGSGAGNKKYNSNGAGDPLKSLAEMNSMGGSDCKWGVAKPEPVSCVSPTQHHQHQHPSSKSPYHHHHHHHPQHHQVVTASHHHHHHHHHQQQHAAGSGGGITAYNESGAGSEVWPVHHQYHHQYYPYTTPYHHHHAPHTPVSDNGYPQINRTGVLCCPSLR